MDKTLSDAILVANDAGLTDRDIAAVVEAAGVARRAADAQSGLVTVTHPDVGELQVDPEAVEVYARSGWTVQADEPADEPAKPAKASKAAAKKETP